MRDEEEEARLLAALTECQRLSRAASAALTHPDQIVVYNSSTHRRLMEADAEARLKYAAARVALRAYRTPPPRRRNNRGGVDFCIRKPGGSQRFCVFIR